MKKWFPISADILSICSFGESNKVWVQKLGPCIQLRCPYKFETYTGASKSKDSSKPLGPQVVNSLLSVVKNPTYHRVYFDNFFTSYSLLRYLHENKFRVLGTIRKNCTMKCPLRLSKVVLKEKRVFYDYRSDDYVSIVQ